MPGFRGGSSEPVQFVLGGTDYTELKEWAEKLKIDADQSPYMEGVNIDYQKNTRAGGKC